MWANGSPGSTSPSKVRKTGRTASCRRLSVMAMSRIGWAPSATCLPDADGLEQPPRRRHDGGRARIGAGAAERRIGDRDDEGGAEPLAQGDRQRKAGETSAADQHVGALCMMRQ